VSPTIPIRGRSSAGRASPLQGEGQEFESPRLHHLRRRHPDIVDTEGPLRGSGPIARATGSHRQDHRRLIRALLHRSPPTSTTLGRPRPARCPLGGVAPSQVDIPIGNQNDDFAVIKGVIPDIPRFRPVGQEPWGSSYKGHGVDALAPRADEGRGRLRKASGSREQTLIRGCPNGETRQGSCPVTPG
jgi:hypothetical protein